MTDTQPEQNRRFTDMQVERLSKVESEVTHIKGSVDSVVDKLNGHIEQNSRGFEELRGSMQRLAVASEVQTTISKQQADSMTKLADTVKDIAKNDFKISSLEEFKVNTLSHLRSCDAKHDATKEKLNKTTEKIDRLYWLAPLALLAIQGIWQLYTYFAK